MKSVKKLSKRSTALLCAFSIMFLAFSSSFPTGRTGAPGDGLCTDCHSDNGSFTGDITLSGVPATAMANSTYNITVTVDVTGGSPIRAGFSTTSLDSNDNAAGDWTNPSSDATLKNAGGREYFGHEPAVNFGAGSSISWDADWTAPNITDDVTFYIASMLANGSGTNGDNILTLEETISVMQPVSAISISFTNISPPTCNGDDDGFAEAVASGGVPPYEYDWDNGANTAGANLTGGVHSVTVTDDTGATEEATVDIPEPDELEIDTDIVDLLCNGDGSGEIEVFASGGTGNIDCTWATLSSGCSQANLSAGTYMLTITDDNGCTETESITVLEPSALTNALIQVTNETGPGAQDGSASASVTGGTPPYQYDWDNGDSGQTITGLAGGTYCVTITDDNGCDINTCAVVMTMPPVCAIGLTANVTNVSCNGDADGSVSLNVTNSTGALSYDWSNNATSASIQNITAGTYAVTVTDANGCTEELSNIVVTEPTPLTISISIVDESSPGTADGSATANVSGGTTPYDYDWDNGGTTQTITGLVAGTYCVTVIDDNDCEIQTCGTVNSGTAPCGITLSSNITNVSCAGGADGSVSLNVTNSTGTLSYNWSNNTTASTLQNVTAGTYSVTVTDQNGCSQSLSNIVVTQPSALSLNLTAVDESMAGLADGSVSANVGGGTAPYAYLWDNGATTQMITGLTAGTYCVTVTDNNSCTTQACATVSTTGSPCAITLNPNVMNVDCFGQSTGAVGLFVMGATAPITYAWSNNTSSANITNVPAGMYGVTVTDANGCMQFLNNIVVTQPSSPLTVTTTFVDESMPAINDGSASANATGGTAPYAYLWSNGAAIQSITNLSPGDYCVTVTDSNNCMMVSCGQVISAGPQCGITLSPIVTNAACANQATGSVSLNVMGAVAPISYAWSNNTSSSSIQNIVPGTYSVVVTDGNGCSQSLSNIIVGNNDVTPPSIVVQEAVVELDGNGNGTPLTISDVTVSITDNCSIVSSTLTNVTYTCSDIGCLLYTSPSSRDRA